MACRVERANARAKHPGLPVILRQDFRREAECDGHENSIDVSKFDRSHAPRSYRPC